MVIHPSRLEFHIYNDIVKCVFGICIDKYAKAFDSDDYLLLEVIKVVHLAENIYLPDTYNINFDSARGKSIINTIKNEAIKMFESSFGSISAKGALLDDL